MSPTITEPVYALHDLPPCVRAWHALDAQQCMPRGCAVTALSGLDLGWVQGLVKQAEIMDTEASDSEEDDRSGSSGPEHQLYTRGQRSHHFTLVLQACSDASCSQRIPYMSVGLGHHLKHCMHKRRASELFLCMGGASHRLS